MDVNPHRSPPSGLASGSLSSSAMHGPKGSSCQAAYLGREFRGPCPDRMVRSRFLSLESRPGTLDCPPSAHAVSTPATHHASVGWTVSILPCRGLPLETPLQRCADSQSPSCGVYSATAAGVSPRQGTPAPQPPSHHPLWCFCVSTFPCRES